MTQTWVTWAAVVLLTILGGALGRAATLMVFAAASLTDGLKQVAVNYEGQTGDKLMFNFAGSSFLARQIEEGAQADLFFSADEAKMDQLETKGLIAQGTRKALLSNSLVIVVGSDSPIPIHAAADLAGAQVKRIALADPKAVPAGIYARQYLQAAKVWNSIQGKLIPMANVRAALAAVESGDVDAAVVYRTDAKISSKVKVAYEVPKDLTPRISYPVAVLQGTSAPAAARQFLKYLGSPESRRTFSQFGFTPLD